MGINLVYIAAILYGVISGLGMVRKEFPSFFVYIFLVIIALYFIYYSRRDIIEFYHTIIAGILVNLTVQLTGGVQSPLFLAYVVTVPIIAYKERYTRYWIITLSILGVEITSSLLSGTLVIAPLIIFAAAIILFGIMFKRQMEREVGLKESLMKYEAREQLFRPAEFESKDIVTSVSDIDRHAAIERPLLYFVRFIHAVFKSYTTAIFAYTENKLVLIQGFSQSKVFRPDVVLSAESGIYRQVISGRKSVLIEEFVQNPQELGYYDDEIAISSVIIAPVIVQEHVEGIFVIDRKDERFSEVDKVKFDVASKTVALLLTIVRLYEKKSYEARALNFIADRVQELKELELDKILSDAVQSFKVVMECSDVTIASIDELNNTGDVLQSTYIKKHTTFSLDDGLVGMIARHRNVIIKEDLSQGNVIVYKKGEERRNLSFIGMPILNDDEILGVMWCEDEREKKFTEEDIKALNIIASHLSLAWQRAHLHEQIKEQAERDSLTGLYNHRHFQETLEAEMNRRHDVVLLLFDIDHFKMINDTYGHQAGDEVLKYLAGIIQHTGIAARYGGEEFTIILPDYSLERGLRVASRLKDHLLKSEILFKETRLSITISIGVAHYPKDAKNRVDLIEKADRALYRAKHTGRNKIVVAQLLDKEDQQGQGYQDDADNLLP
jgi:diguanylate cyclase (GGDEF)-like protein